MLTLHAADLVLPIADEPIPGGGVLVEDDRVREVGAADALAARFPQARVRGWPGVLMPGLVNAHAHLQYTDFADLAGHGWPFSQWIGALAARRPTFSDADWSESTRRGVHAVLRTGTTAVADIVTDPPALLPTARAGLAGVSYVEVLGADQERWEKGGRDGILATLASAPGGRRLGLSPHTVYTVAPEVFADVVRLARERGLRLHPHLAETADEEEFVRSGTGALVPLTEALGMTHPLVTEGGRGCSSTELLDSLDALGPDVHVAHGVRCVAQDRDTLARHGTAVAVCTRSNRILGSGEPPLAAYLDEGRPVALGTDSLASSPSLDLWAEAAAARALALAQGYAAADLDRRLVEAVTVGGAAAMGLVRTTAADGADDSVGVLAPGVRADLAVFDVPTDGDPYAALLEHGEGSCVATVLRGRIVHRASH